jgi:hypothetical protein
MVEVGTVGDLVDMCQQIDADIRGSESVEATERVRRVTPQISLLSLIRLRTLADWHRQLWRGSDVLRRR